MNSAEQAYLGDDALAGMLKKAGVRVDLSQIRGLLAGVLAAPEGEHPQWFDLVAPGANSSCPAQLER
jgi:Xaa-Pro aminopeptidase